MYTVRRAEEKDISQILKLLIQVDMVHHNGRPDIFKGPVTKYTAEQLKEILRHENDPVFVCVDENDTVLGHAFCIHKQEIGNNVLTDIKTLYIDDICVDEEARGRHVGSALYEAVKKYAAENAYYHITLNVWSCNPVAESFYKKLGFKPLKTEMEVML